MELIRTSRKEKLPRGFSYPVGAEMVSAALQGVPSYSTLSMSFSWRTFWGSDYQRALKDLGRITVIQVYTFRGEISLCFCSVPADHSQSARTSLLESGLPALAALLCSAASPMTKIDYDLKHRTLIVNDQHTRR